MRSLDAPPCFNLWIIALSQIDNRRGFEKDESYSELFELVGILLRDQLTRSDAEKTSGNTHLHSYSFAL